VDAVKRKSARTTRGIALAAIAALAWFAACSDNPCCGPPPVSSIIVTPPSQVLVVGATAQFSAIVRNASGQAMSGLPIVWHSTDATVVSVDSTGLVKGLGPGTAEVIAASGGVSDTAAITVSSIVIPSGMSLIAFASGAYLDAAIGGIKVMTADRSSIGTVTTSGGDWDPAWSPDGTRLAFESDRARALDLGDIFVVNWDGSGLVQLTNDESDDREPAWSPDGSRIVFDRWSGIWVMNAADGSGATMVTLNGSHASWSPDGSRIVFAGPDRHIWVMQLDGSGLTQLTNAGYDGMPAWSPDGTKIAFQHGSTWPDSWAIYLMNPDGTEIVQLTLEGQRPAWSPDSRMIVYEDSGINVINADGSGLTRVGDGFAPAWSRVGSMPPPRRAERFIAIAGGDGQSDSVHSVLPEPLSVLVTDTAGTPVSGVTIDWILDAQAQESGVALSVNRVTTDASGIASVSLTLGGALGTVQVRATITDGSARLVGVVFTATATTGSVASVIVRPSPVVLLLQMTVQLSATPLDANNFVLTGRPIAWASDNASLATVDTNGLVTGIGAGSATITATVDGRQGSATVHVTRLEDVLASLQGDWLAWLSFGNPRTRVCSGTGSFFFASDTGSLGGTAGFLVPTSCGGVGLRLAPISGFQVSSTGFAFNAACSFAGGLPWDSATTIGGGVRCGTASGRWSAVRSGPPVSVSIAPAAPTIIIGAMATLAGQALNANGDVLLGRLLTWSSDDPAVATVSSSGVVTAVGLGSTTIRAATADVRGQVTVTVVSGQQ
jgi:uncharacterized protein YjdB